MFKISETLYQRYYQQDVTPEDLVSSHWKEYHQHIDIDWEKGPAHWKGFGFGDLQAKRFHHKVLAWMTIFSYFFFIPRRRQSWSLIGRARRLVNAMDVSFSIDIFRQLCAFILIKPQLEKILQEKKRLRIVNIGDGYGFLSILVKDFFPQAQLCLIDLGKVLLFQSYYLQRVHPQLKFALVDEQWQGNDASSSDVLFCPAEHIDRLADAQFDFAVNINSMQEMNRQAVVGYFDFLRAHLSSEGLFYCCNRIEKIMPGGEVSRIDDYPWQEQDQVLFDEVCPWLKYYLALRPTEKGPRVLGLRMPLINYYDGLFKHRLVQMSSSPVSHR